MLYCIFFLAFKQERLFMKLAILNLIYSFYFQCIYLLAVNICCGINNVIVLYKTKIRAKSKTLDYPLNKS